MRIKEAARKTGLTEKTIRYYESRGLVVPDTEERNGRLWRDYTEAHVRALRAVATLRKAGFHVEEIETIQHDPGRIPETLRAVAARAEEAFAALIQLREQLKCSEVLEARDFCVLADGLTEAAAPLSLPPQDLKFNFKALDRLLAEERKAVEGAPSNPLRFGWVELYRGQDEVRFQDMRQQLTLFGIEHRAYSYTKGSRLAAQGFVNASNPAWAQKNGTTNQAIQAKLLGDRSMDSYAIEVRKRDEEKARRALRSKA